MCPNLCWEPDPVLQVSSSRVCIMDLREDVLQPQSPQTGRLIHMRVTFARDYACFREVLGRFDGRSVEDVVLGHPDLG